MKIYSSGHLLFKIYFCLAPLFTLIFLFIPSMSLGQPSIIETAQNAMPSLVNVTADGMDAIQNPHANAVVDKNTGRLVILKQVKTAYFKKTGAGIIIDPSGIIVTNYHTVANAKRIIITLYDKTDVSAELLSAYPNEDFVFLRINPPAPLTFVSFADSDALTLNEEIFTIGHSDVLDQTISEGKIIGLGSSRTKSENDAGADIFQVNINIYHGDSGGPLLNRNGEFVGLMTAGQLEKDRSSFAIASNKIRRHYLEYLKSLREKK